MRLQHTTTALCLLLAMAGASVTISTGQFALARTAETPVDAHPPSVLGNYLAGRFARATHDTQNAVRFYRNALDRDPDNLMIAEHAFQVEAVEGNYVTARDLALKLVKAQPNHRLANVWLGVSSFERGDFTKAREYFTESARGPIGELTSILALAWLDLATGNTEAALKRLDQPGQVEWARFYISYHKALIAEQARNAALAEQNYARIFRIDSRTPRFTIAYASHLARIGKIDLARSILRQHIERTGDSPHPMIADLLQRIDRKAELPVVVATPAQGLSEVFYGLGEALAGEGGLSIGASYIRLALQIDANSSFALATLANIHESMKQHDRAIEIYDRIPKGSAMDSAVEIRKAINLGMLERIDEAKALLDGIVARNPKDVRPLDALGNLMRSRKRFEEAAEYYTKIIELIPAPDKQHWTFWYSRGTSFERLKRWSDAERDLKKALVLHPDQPLVLNYLGYSWIDQNINLTQGMRLIEKAVALKPDDGYIVDSLGWAHYKLRHYAQAVRHLERAVQLRPEDPVLNDHLGDALWRTGREREAIFQWEQALTLKPEPNDEAKIKQKLISGLAAEEVKKPARKQVRRPARNKQASNENGSATQSILPFQ